MIQIKQNRECCGCSACAVGCPTACISMVEDSEGFLYPKVDAERCIECGLCERVCPVINTSAPREALKNIAAKSYDSEIQQQSSSGGIFTHLAQRVIEDRGVVFGAKFNKEWAVVHSSAHTIEQIAPFRGSKYLQSYENGTFAEAKALLKSGRKVLYSGTPCQIAALKLYLGKEWDNLLTVDFICHGTPSPKIWREYLRSITDKEISSINFRNKSRSWSRFRLSIVAQDEGNTQRTILSEPLDVNLYLRAFNKGLLMRPSCYHCPTKELKSGSDITLADFWGVKRHLPHFDNNRGVSLVMANSTKGIEALQGLPIKSIEVPYHEAIKGNPAATKSVAEPTKRAKIFDPSTDSITKRLKRALYQPLHTRIVRAIKISFAEFLVSIKRHRH